MSDSSSDWVGSGRPPQAGEGKRRRSGWLVGVAAALVVVIGAGAALAVQALSGAGAQPDSAVPATALGFARIDLDPSADQKVNAVRLLRRVPEFEQETGITSDRSDLRKLLYETVAGDGCPGYAEGVESWLGDRAGFAAMPAESGEEPDALAVVQVTDEDAAREGIGELGSCTGSDETGVAFAGDYAVIAETQRFADGFATAAQEAPLSDDEDYLADMAAAGDPGIVSAWLDLDALVRLSGDDQEAAAGAALLGGASSMAMSMGAGSDSLEVAVAVNGQVLGEDPGATSFSELPASTMFGIGFTGGADAVRKGWDQAQQSLSGNESFDPQGLAEMVEAQTGLVLPDDLATLLGDDFVLAVDSQGLELDPSGQPDPTSVRVGLRTSSDLAEVQEVTAKIEAALAAVVPVDLVERESDRGAVVASNDAYAEALADDDSLGDSGNFQAAVADADAAAIMFVDFDLMLEVADRGGEQAGDQLPGDARKMLEVLRAFGVSSSVDGDYTTSTVRLVFD